MTTISPDKVTFEDKSLMEQVLLIAELEPEDKNMVLKMIDTFLTKKKKQGFLSIERGRSIAQSLKNCRKRSGQKA
ncbi:hypothetical protein [Schleiferia thermophila]